jgi:PAB1-binding protein PBP1
VAIEHQNKLYDLLDELERAQEEIQDVLVKKQREVIELSSLQLHEEETEEGKKERTIKEKETIEKLKKMTKEIKQTGRDLEKKVLDIRLDIAVLLFSRASSGVTKDRVKKFMDKEQLFIIEHIAKGVTIPPPQLPEKQENKQKNV